MEAPKCRTCGERHWERVCPKFAAKAVAVVKAKPVALAVADPPAKPAWDRNAHHKNYMRDYMRRHRAKKKAEKASPTS